MTQGSRHKSIFNSGIKCNNMKNEYIVKLNNFETVTMVVTLLTIRFLQLLKFNVYFRAN